MSQNPNISRIISQKLTKPLDVFTHVSEYNGTIYVSCIQGFLPGTFTLPKNIEEEAQQMMWNLETILKESHSSLRNIIKLTLFFSNMARDFQVVNSVINNFSPINPPSRSSIGVSQLPVDCKVVIDCIAAKNSL